MSDYLAIIREVLAEHELLKANVKRVRDSVNDLEGVFALDQASSEWSQSSLEMLHERHTKLRDTLWTLGTGINRHFDYEERSLPPIFGPVLMQGLIAQHAPIRVSIKESEFAVVEAVGLGDLKREDALAKKGRAVQSIVDLRHALAAHVEKEEVILRMLEEGLQSGKVPAGK